MADAFNPNSFTMPWVHNSATGVDASRGGNTEEEGGVGKDLMSQLSEVCVRVCMYQVSGPRKLLLLMVPVVRAG